MPLSGLAQGLGEGLAGYVRYLRELLARQMQEQAEEKSQQRWMTQTQALEDLRRSAEERAAERRRQEREEHLADPLVQAQRTSAQRELDPAYQAARQRMQAYWPRFAKAQLQANPQLLAQFLKDNELLGGAIPTQTIPETMERRTPEMATTTPPPSLSDTLRGVAQDLPTGRDVVQQVPTGRDLTLPILPDAPTKRVVFVNQQGQVVQDVTLPEGTEIKTLTPPTPKDPARFIITDSKGNVVRELEAPAGTQMRVLPAPPQPRAGGASTEGLTPNEKRVVDAYNRLVDQRDRLTGMLTQGVVDDATKARITGQMADVDAQIARLRPQVDQIFYGKPAPAPAGRPDTTGLDVTAGVTEAAKKGLTWEQVASDLQRAGITPTPAHKALYDANVKKPRPTAWLASQVKGLKSEGMTWGQARVLLMRRLLTKGYTPQEAKAVVDDPHVKGAFELAPARR